MMATKDAYRHHSSWMLDTRGMTINVPRLTKLTDKSAL